MIGFANHNPNALIYLGSAYSDKDQLKQKINFAQARDAAAWMLNKGLYVYSPIVHCHDIATHYVLPHDYSFWKHYNRRMLQAADEFCALRTEGFNASIGLKGEMADAKDLGKPMYQCFRRADGEYEFYLLEL